MYILMVLIYFIYLILQLDYLTSRCILNLFHSAHTIVSHDVFHGGPAEDSALVPAEDLGPWTEVIGVVLPQLAPHQSIATQVVDLRVKRDIVGSPVSL